MSEFLECQACKRFLTCSDDLSRGKHVLQCLRNCDILNSNEEAPVKIEYLTDYDNRPNLGDRNHFKKVIFPEVKVQISRHPDTGGDDDVLHARATTRPRRVRKRRYPSSDYEIEDFHDAIENIEEETKIGPKRGRKPRLNGGKKGLTEKQKKYNKMRNRALGPAELFIRTYKLNCDKCPAKFYSKKELDSHMSIHNGRRGLMTCLICLRVFNKRDSLNSHILAHITAEEMEERNFFIGEVKLTGPHARLRLVCKYCLLVHPSKKSFKEHYEKEHDKGDSIQFPCRMGKCSKQYGTIRELVEHAKSAHSKEYYGHLAWLRMTKGVYYVRQPVGQPAKEEADKIRDDNDKSSPISPNKKKKSAKRKRRRRNAPSEDDEDDDDDWFEEMIDGTTSAQPNDRSEENKVNKIEIECVNITSAGNVIVKREVAGKSSFGAVPKVEVDPFNLVESDCQNDSDNEATPIPIILGVKTEIL